MANKQLTLYKGQTKDFQCKATYEGKNAIDKVMTLTDEVDFKNLVEPMGGELNPDGVHLDLYLCGMELGTGTVAIPFGYDGKTEGVEGVDISTVNLDIDVRTPNLTLVPQSNIFEYDTTREYDLLITMKDGDEVIVLNDPGVMFMDGQAMVDIITVGPDRIMIKVNAGWQPTAGSVTGTIKAMYYDASVDVEYTFNVPQINRELIAEVEGGSIPTFTAGEKKLTIKDQNDQPVTDAEFVSVNVSNERPVNNVFDYVGQYLRPVDPTNGVYAFDYSSGYMGSTTTLAFKIKSGEEIIDLNPVTITFEQEPYSVQLTPEVIPKGPSTASVDVAITIRRTKNGSQIPITGTIEMVGQSGATMKTTPPLSSPYRIRTFKLSGIPSKPVTGVAYIMQLKFTDTENNSTPQSLLLQIPFE